MKKFFYIGLFGLILFEIANVYFIMPMPGSQQMNSIDFAYFLYSYRWFFRILLLCMLVVGAQQVFTKSGKAGIITAGILLLATGGIAYATNFMMAADSMFRQPKNLQLKDAASGKADSSRLVLGIEYKGMARAYPIQFLGYHHQVFDTIAGKPVIVTYCTVCRTGRVFEPVVNGKLESFRLVGMDHFNAMFEDKTTKSWWRQATGEAITGKLKGNILPEYPCSQVALKEWLTLYPTSLIMQADTNFRVEYDSMSNYEKGKLYGKLTRRDTLSWKDKSWVVGIIVGKESKAYDWNVLQKQKIIEDVVDNIPIVLVLADDNESFAAFKRKSNEQHFILNKDTLSDGMDKYLLNGKAIISSSTDLQKLQVYQEYWHSWKTFHPLTKK